MGCSHEEVATRMLLHAKFSNSIVHSDDTSVFILLFAHLDNFAKVQHETWQRSEGQIVGYE